MPKNTAARRRPLPSYCMEDRDRHFSIEIRARRSDPIDVILKPEWTSLYDCGVHQARVERERWDVIRPVWVAETKRRLREAGFDPGEGFRVGETKVDYAVGRELLLLAWASEGCDVAGTQRVVDAWQRLMPCERAWMAVKCIWPFGHDGKDHPCMAWRRAWRAALDGNEVEAVAA